VLRVVHFGGHKAEPLRALQKDDLASLWVSTSAYIRCSRKVAVTPLQKLASGGNDSNVWSGCSCWSENELHLFAKALRLIVDEVNEHDPNDIAYVYSGYAPLSVRLVQSILQKQYLTSITRGGSNANNAAACQLVELRKAGGASTRQ
jgi:hypothetical protein